MRRPDRDPGPRRRLPIGTRIWQMTPQTWISNLWRVVLLIASLSACSSPAGPGNMHGDAGVMPDAGGHADSGPMTDLDTSAPIPAKMNDVSILFPLPSSTADIANVLSASSSGARGTLIPNALYPIVGPISGSTNVDGGQQGPANVTNIAAYSDLKVVAMRIDPCFASLAPDPHGAGCTAQLRLIFQEVLPATKESFGGTGSGASTFDSAVHAFYSLTRDEFLALARALVTLRMSNENGVSLGPVAAHPIMVNQGLGGAMSKGVQQLILQYAGEQNLTRLTQLSNGGQPLTSTDQPGLWVMSGIDISNAATATTSPMVIPALGGSTTLQQPTAVLPAPGNFFLATFSPATTSTDDLTPLDNGSPNGLSASAREAAFDALVRIENPANHSPNTIDCGSCHFATPTAALIGMPVFSLDDTASALAFHPDNKSVMASDMTRTFSTTSIQLNIHAFSYVGQSPAINQRVVNETAAIVEYLNNLPK
jgi:hypothetical protein